MKITLTRRHYCNLHGIPTGFELVLEDTVVASGHGGDTQLAASLLGGVIARRLIGLDKRIFHTFEAVVGDPPSANWCISDSALAELAGGLE